MPKRTLLLIILAVTLSLAAAIAALAWHAPLFSAPLFSDPLPQRTVSFNPAAFAPQPTAPDPTPTTSPEPAADPQVEGGAEAVDTAARDASALQPEPPVCQGPASRRSSQSGCCPTKSSRWSRLTGRGLNQWKSITKSITLKT